MHVHFCLSLSLSLSLSPPLLPLSATIDGYNPEDPGLSSSSSSRGFIPTPVIPPQPIPLQQTFPPPPSIGGTCKPIVYKIHIHVALLMGFHAKISLEWKFLSSVLLQSFLRYI